jgi:hypothetical protein
MITVLHPFPDVAVYVVEAPAIGGVAADGLSLLMGNPGLGAAAVVIVVAVVVRLLGVDKYINTIAMSRLFMRILKNQDVAFIAAYKYLN